jgi:two-component system, OmpR family, sensor kinase
MAPVAALRRLLIRTPLRTKLITAVLGLVIMAIAAISIASVYMLRGYVTTQRDSSLTGLYSHIYLHGLAPGEAEPVQNLPGYVSIVQSPGSQATMVPGNNSGPGFGDGTGTIPSLPTGSNWANGTSETLLTVPSQSGPDSWRIIGKTFSDYTYIDTSGAERTAPTVNVVLAIDLGNINALTTRLIAFDLIVGAAIVVVLAAAGVAVVQTNLRPLNDIEMTAGQIAKGHLDHRVPEGDPRTEIGSLGRSLNKMLSQIESAFHDREASEQAAHESEERMRRFVADASHELRTPLTTIRGFAAHFRQRGGAEGLRIPEAAGIRSSSGTGAAVSGNSANSDHSGGGDGGMTPEELDHLMGRVEAEATRMGLLVEDLLTLARLDQQRPLSKAPVDLLTLAADAVQDARIVDPGRPIDLVVAPGTAFIVEGDEPRLRQVLANLVNNALTHTPDGTPVRVKIAPGTVRDGLPAVVLDVVDDGPGMSAEAAQRVFERFYRADAARNRASGGTGLGLAIVAGLVAAHDGTVSVRTSPGQGADFEVRLPLSPDALAARDETDEEPPA